MQDRGVCWPSGVKHIARHQHELRSEIDNLVHRALERAPNIRLTLVYTTVRETLVLPVAEVEIREMDEAHAL
jgi:hypothetical protein